MGFEQIASTYVVKVAALVQKNIDRIAQARQKLQAGTYKADQLAADAAGTWLDGIDMFVGLLPYVGSPVLPTIYMTLPVSGPSVKQGVYLQDLVPAPANMAVTDLLQLGGAGSIPHATIALAANGYQLDVTFTMPASPPAAGVFQALVHSTLTMSPLALVVLELT
jgi:hypothetical protein